MSSAQAAEAAPVPYTATVHRLRDRRPHRALWAAIAASQATNLRRGHVDALRRLSARDARSFRRVVGLLVTGRLSVEQAARWGDEARLHAGAIGDV